MRRSRSGCWTTRRAVLVLHEAGAEPRTPHFAAASSEPQVVVAPTDLEPASRPVLELGFDLARQLPIDLHLLHVMSRTRGWMRQNGGSEEATLGKLRALVPEELADRVSVHVEHGDVGRSIAEAAERLSAVCIVMGEHGSSRRWLARDTPRVVLHQAHCPVWYVPTIGAA